MQADIVGIGEALVEFNQTGQDEGRNYLQGFGGDTSNAMIAAARQGAHAAYFTRLGDDEFGRMCLDLWAREGVDASAVQVDPLAPTGLYFVTHGLGGHAFTYRRAGSAASRMAPADLPLALICGAKVLHVSGISQAISESACDAIAHAIQAARSAGAKVSYDPNLRLRLWSLERARAVLLATLPQVDWFLPSLDDVQLLSGLTDPDGIVDWCHAHGARQVVLKLGAQGCIVSGPGLRAHVPAFSVDVVDATGAGDCFDGALLTQLNAGIDLHRAARYACGAAALATTGFGAVAPLPRKVDVDAFLQAHPTPQCQMQGLFSDTANG